MKTIFKDRKQAGKKLSRELADYKDRRDVIVLGLPRGGVPVAFEVAKALNVPLDVFVVRKLGVPGQPELAMGAIASGGAKVMNQKVVQEADLSENNINQVIQEEKEKLESREDTYCGARPEINIENKVIILVDDGLATGASMKAAITALKDLNPEKIIMAVPTAPEEACQEFKTMVDHIICLENPKPFWGVGGSYQDFLQTTHDEVRDLLNQAKEFGTESEKD